MTELKEELALRLSEMRYGEIQAVPMIDRGPYRDLEAAENLDISVGASKLGNELFADIAPEIKAADEDFISVQRREPDFSMTQSDFEQYFRKLTAVHHLIFVDCLELGTSEIRAFLLVLEEKKLLEQSKVFLLDMSQLEYLMMHDSLAGKIDM
jgi:hypothetical protein